MIDTSRISRRFPLLLAVALSLLILCLAAACSESNPETDPSCDDGSASDDGQQADDDEVTEDGSSSQDSGNGTDLSDGQLLTVANYALLSAAYKGWEEISDNVWQGDYSYMEIDGTEYALTIVKDYECEIHYWEYSYENDNYTFYSESAEILSEPPDGSYTLTVLAGSKAYVNLDADSLDYSKVNESYVDISCDIIIDSSPEISMTITGTPYSYATVETIDGRQVSFDWHCAFGYWCCCQELETFLSAYMTAYGYSGSFVTYWNDRFETAADGMDILSGIDPADNELGLTDGELACIALAGFMQACLEGDASWVYDYPCYSASLVSDYGCEVYYWEMLNGYYISLYSARSESQTDSPTETYAVRILDTSRFSGDLDEDYLGYLAGTSGVSVTGNYVSANIDAVINDTLTVSIQAEGYCCGLLDERYVKIDGRPARFSIGGEYTILANLFILSYAAYKADLNGGSISTTASIGWIPTSYEPWSCQLQ